MPEPLAGLLGDISGLELIAVVAISIVIRHFCPGNVGRSDQMTDWGETQLCQITDVDTAGCLSEGMAEWWMSTLA